MNGKKLVLALILLNLISACFSILAVKYVHAKDPIEEGIVDKRAKVNATYARGDSWSVSYENGLYLWSSEPLAVWDGSKYTPYVIEPHGSYYTVKAPLIGAELHQGKAVFYDPSLTRKAVGRETWVVYMKVNGTWIPIVASLKKYFQISNHVAFENGVNVTGLWAISKGTLKITYEFNSQLKHHVVWTPNQNGKYAVVQFWNDTAYNKVRLQNVTIIKRSEDKILGKADSLTFLFHDNLQPYGVFEDQQSAENLLHKTIFAKGQVNYQGITIENGVAWIFYNETLCNLKAGEKLVIDPTTSTITPPTDDAYVSYFYKDNNYGGSSQLSVYWDYSMWEMVRFGYMRFDITSIPDEAEVTSGKLSLYLDNCGADPKDGPSVILQCANDTWDEMEITYNDHPGSGSELASVTVSDAMEDTYVNHTGTIGDWVGSNLGDNLVSFRIATMANNNDNLWDWCSKEGANAPKLYVTYTLNEPNPPTLNNPADGSRFNMGTTGINFTWTFSDPVPSNDNQTGYQIQLDNNQGFGSPEVDSGYVASGNEWSTQDLPNSVDEYYWRVRTWDEANHTGEWSSSRIVVSERWKLSNIWVSDETPLVGQQIYVYATGGLESDGHGGHADDNLQIEGLTFTYDWSEERWWATDSQSNPGLKTYDTLDSMYEDTYNITLGTMDGKSASSTWCNASYDFYGLYYENGTLVGAVNVTTIFQEGSETFELNGLESKTWEEGVVLFTWPLSGGGTRYYYPISNNETVYVFNPESNYTSITFTLYCYGQALPGYLEATRFVNETKRVIERKLVTAEQNKVPMMMTLNEVYFMRFRASDDSLYDLGIFVPGSSIPTYTIGEVGFPSDVKMTYRWITIAHSRSDDNTQIKVNYKDKVDRTNWIGIEITYKNGSSAYQANNSNPGSTVQFQWNNADNETNYLGLLTVGHEDFPEGFEYKMAFPLYVPEDKPFDLSFLGDFGGGVSGFDASDLICIGIIIVVAAPFSAYSAVIGSFTATLVTAGLIGIGWLDWGYGLPTLAFFIVVVMGLNQARSGG